MTHQYMEIKIKELENRVKALEQGPCEHCEHSDEINGSNCYECIKGIRDRYNPQPCEDAISREDALKLIYDSKEKHAEDREKHPINYGTLLDLIRLIRGLPPVNPQPKIWHCKDCKWWKDSDGLYRRGCHAESQCPINRREVFEGNGYCYMFEPKESEE